MTPSRPTLSKNVSQPVGIPTYAAAPTDERQPQATLGKFSNGSSTSIVTPGTSIGSAPGFLAARKGSLASIKNAFKGSKDPSYGVPPVPTFDSSSSAAGYPALKNPFSRYDSTSSPVNALFGHSPRAGRQALNNGGPPATPGAKERKPSSVNTHVSQRSHGGRSIASNGSTNLRTDDHPLPSLPPIPMRATPSRLGRAGNESGSAFQFGSRRNGSIGGGDEASLGKTPGEEALRMIFKDFKASADAKIQRVCGRPLVSCPYKNRFGSLTNI